MRAPHLDLQPRWRPRRGCDSSCRASAAQTHLHRPWVRGLKWKWNGRKTGQGRGFSVQGQGRQRQRKGNQKAERAESFYCVVDHDAGEKTVNF
jgi:hypothetical protein